MIAILYVTHKNLKNAKKISRYMIEKKLVACANIFPIDTMYIWNKTLVNDKEYASILKTSTAKAGVAEKEIKKIHPYKMPCIIKFRVDSNTDYENWINNM